MNVVAIRPAQSTQLVSKRQLAAHIGRSTRWIEMKTATEGLPSIAPSGHYSQRRYDLAAVEAWIRDGAPRPASLTERVAALEARLNEIERRTA